MDKSLLTNSVLVFVNGQQFAYEMLSFQNLKEKTRLTFSSFEAHSEDIMRSLFCFPGVRGRFLLRRWPEREGPQGDPRGFFGGVQGKTIARL